MEEDYVDLIDSNLERAGIIDEDDRKFLMFEMKRLAMPDPQVLN